MSNDDDGNGTYAGPVDDPDRYRLRRSLGGGTEGEVWLADLGRAAKVRPCLILSVAPGPDDRVLYALVPHTTAVQGSAYEVAVIATFLKPGAFNVQGLAAAPRPRLIRHLGLLPPTELAKVEAAVRVWLAL